MRLNPGLSAPLSSPPVPPRKPAIIFIFITLLLDVLGFGLLIPVTPHLVERLQAAHGIAGNAETAAPTYAWLIATYAIMQFLFAPAMGSLSDRFGRRPVILISLFGSGLDYFAMAFAPSVPWLFLTRALNGLSGASMTTAQAYIADVTPPEKRAAGFGMIGAAFGLGFILGPLMGGVLGAPSIHIPFTSLTWHGDVHYPFYAAGGITLLNWLYGFFVLPESLPPDRRTPTFDASRANPVGALIGIARYPLVIGMAFAMFFLNTAQFALHSTWVLYTGTKFKWDELKVGLSLFAVGLGSAIVMAGLARRIVPALGERRSLMIGLTIGVLSYIGYAAVPEGWMMYVIIAFGSLGGITMPAWQSLITRTVRPDEQGRVQGALSSISSISQVVGPVMGGNIFAWSISARMTTPIPGLVFYACALLGAIGAGIAAWAVYRAPKVQPA